MSSPIALENNLHEAQDVLLARHSAGNIKRYVFPKDTILFQKGETRHCAFLIDSGEVHIFGNDEGGEDKLLCSLGEGEIFGETALIDSTPRTATAVTVSDQTEIFVIPRDALYERTRGLDPIIGLLISLLIERYRVTRIHLPESIKQDNMGDLMERIAKMEPVKGAQLVNNLEDQREIALQELKLEQELRAGLKNREFNPVLQPILSLPEKKLVGFEALIRWNHPERGLVMPDQFIPVAERTGVVHSLDRMMLEKACEFIPKLQKKLKGKADDVFVSVNLSGINFATVDVVNTVSRVLEIAGTNPANINLEITESALIADPDFAQESLQRLKEIGVTISLDDFGTGYSSLSYLHKFTFDSIKIDRSFIFQLHDGKSLDIVRAIIALARNFDLKVVAEGIEKNEDIIALNSLDCDMGQGFLFAKPLSQEDALKFASENLA